MESMNDLYQEINQIIRRGNFIYEEFYSFINGISGMPVYSYKITKGSTFYRSRINEKDADYYLFKDLGHPKKEFVTKFGRANRPNQNLLYLSDTEETSFSEVLPQEINNKVVLTKTKWIVEDDLIVRIIPDFENEKMQELISSISKSEIKNQIDFLKVMNFYFRAESENGNNNYAYELTSAFCNALLAESIRQEKQHDGTLFTSVQKNKGFNLSLKTDLVKEGRIRIVDVEKHCLIKLGDSVVVETEKPKRVDYHKGIIEWK